MEWTMTPLCLKDFRTRTDPAYALGYAEAQHNLPANPDALRDQSYREGYERGVEEFLAFTGR
jgi:hypothetical protein